jgi:hypothetical protein
LSKEEIRDRNFKAHYNEEKELGDTENNSSEV